MLSRLLNLCGVYLGDERDMVPAQESNLAGHWEHARLDELNNQVLEALGGSWQEPPLPPDHWERLPEIAPLRAQAAECVRATFAESGAESGELGWGWKDSRTSLTGPFWRAVLPDIHYVIRIRNPLDVAASLAARDHMSGRKALALWHGQQCGIWRPAACWPDASRHVARRPRWSTVLANRASPTPPH